MRRRIPHFFSGENFRFWFLGGAFLFFFAVILSKLFFLQIIKGEDLQKEAKGIRSSSIEISARRGGIFTQDSKTGDIAPLAINTTLYKVFVDARSEVNGVEFLSEDDLHKIASYLTEELYTYEEFKKCLENAKWCPEKSVLEIKDEKDIIIHRIFPTYRNAKKYFKAEVLRKILEQKKTIIYATGVDEKILRKIEALGIANVQVSISKKNITIDLSGLTSTNKEQIIAMLQQFFGGEKEYIQKKLTLDRKGYVPIMSRVKPEMREKILEKKQKDQKKYLEQLAEYKKSEKLGVPNLIPPSKPFLKGVGFSPEPLRYYPENDLLANVVGFVSNNHGSYGIEKYFNTFLSGENGVFETSRDVNGNAISIKKEDSEKVVDGGDIVLTIDRILQKRFEKILDEKVKKYKADSAQAILMNPQTGEIIVMANSPRFNPNFFGDVYQRRRTTPDDLETIYKTTPLEKKDEEGNFFPVQYKDFERAWELEFDPEFYVFENILGPAAYANKTISSIYEVGSTIKPLIIASAIEEGEITAHSSYFETHPIEVGDYTIRNADGKYLGAQTVTQGLERSANLLVVWIAQKMGKPLLYEALKKMGFGEYTDISLPDELSGEIIYFEQWADATLFTASFGQGFSATPLQLVQAWTALANDGFMVSPRIVSYRISATGEKKYTETSRKKIFSQDTVSDLNTILISSTENGVARKGRVAGHYIAGKTGTSQISGPNGYEDLEEKGSTITSFIGFAPVENPQFLLFVKFDRPRDAEGGRSVYGSTTAAPTFSQLMEMVFLYYDVPDDKKR